MTTKSLNFTERAKISPEKIDLRLVRLDDRIRLTGEVDLTGLTLPSQFRVLVETYRQTYREVVEAGTKDPSRAIFNGDFEAFGAVDTLLCVVKVLGVGSNQGKILAWAEKLRPTVEGAASGSDSFLPTDKGDLGQLIWKLDVSEDVPTLIINSAIDGWREFAREPRFQWLVMPEVLRGVGHWLSTRLDDADDGSDATAALWLGFIRDLGVEPTEFEGSESNDQWIEQSVAAFAERYKFVENVLRSIEGTES